MGRESKDISTNDLPTIVILERERERDCVSHYTRNYGLSNLVQGIGLIIHHVITSKVITEYS